MSGRIAPRRTPGGSHSADAAENIEDRTKDAKDTESRSKNYLKNFVDEVTS